LDYSLCEAIVELKADLMANYKRSNLFLEALPLSTSDRLPIDNNLILNLHKFMKANPIYINCSDTELASTPCMVYEGEINNYWLSSKKHDTSYQPFYPTWMLSAFALAYYSKSLGYSELIDIGSGDGRIAYCATMLGLDAYGIEIDNDLVELQRSISESTEIKYTALKSDATDFDYSTLKLSKPIFFISGLPEMGEMLANSVMSQIRSIPSLRHTAGINLMGSYVMKLFSRDHTYWGWGTIISSFDLNVIGTVTLPTFWTSDQKIDTAYIYARFN
jgi:hypothetical protein